ncbi:MAG: hypothetical protein HYX92_22560 [Chloroflexi bacterium]|nr:hypothetical protein [Chloroflexota bacterium]
MTTTSKRIDISDDYDAIYEYAYANGWTDGLPIVPPTEERVGRMIGYVGREGSEVIAEIPPAMGDATIEKIAVNAVMAGCRPEYMPVLIATVEAMVEPKFSLYGLQDTTNPVAPLVIVNGPIRRKLDINCGAGLLGPCWRSNATIGRAVRLMLLNIGGATPGSVDKATHGMPGKYTFCCGENEEDSPWEPLHVSRGLPAGSSAVTLIAPSGTINVNAANRDPKEIVLLIAQTLAQWGSNSMVYGMGEPLVILNTGHAVVLAAAGYSKADVQMALWQDSGVVASIIPYKSRSRPALERPDGIARAALRPEDILIMVGGAPEPLHAVVLHPFGSSTAVTKQIADF